jgi:DNA-binding CsgD family transcriptional regulator
MAKGDSDTCYLVVPVHGIEAVFGLTATTALERYSRLTPRERQVAAMIAAGAPTHQIAAELAVSKKTLPVHRMRIKAKLAAPTEAHIANVVNLVLLVEQSNCHRKSSAAR